MNSANQSQELKALRYENAKLKKINQVLVERIEKGLGNYSGAYASFENAVILAEKVKERTIQLQQAMNNLESVNNDLVIAKRDSERKHQLLIDAIESISDAFVLFDQQRHFILANTAFYQLWVSTGIEFKPGATMQEIQAQIANAGLIDTSIPSSEKITRRSEHSNQGLFHLKDGRWIQITERQTREGGLVIIFTDITALKLSEAAHREQALEKKSQVLQSTLDHLSQGVALFNDNHCLEAWNNRFIELTKIPAALICRGTSYKTLAPHNKLSDWFPDAEVTRTSGYKSQKILTNKRILEVQRHTTSSGGFVVTCTDITEREEYEAALKASENRIRLITDAMPALIGHLSKEIRYTFANKAFEKWFQRPRQDIDTLSLRDILGAEEFARHYPYIKKTLAGQHVSFEIEQELPNGQKYIHKTYIPDYNESGVIQGLFTLEQDVTQQRRTAEALKHAYQHMEHRVTERTKELTDLNAKLFAEVAEHKETEKLLVEAKREAEHANLSKTKFLAAASHDLLQPMSAARLFTTALQEYKLPLEAKKLVDALNYSMENVETLVSTLVDISKLDAGVVEPDIASVCANRILENIANEFRQQAKLAGLRFHFVSSSAILATDPHLLARILRNLLSNAIRYTDKGSILFGCRRHSEGLLIQVWDTGIGIPQEKMTEIFLEFKRLPSDKARNVKGLGLGLAIVDKISRILGNRIYVRSELGKGSVFSILVPYGQPHAPQTLKEEQISALKNPTAGRRILVVDNDTSICKGMETLLNSWGCRVTTTTSIHALNTQTLKKLRPDLVIADYHLDNDETGIDAAQQLRHWLGQSLPVLMITANHSQSLKQQVRELGFHLLNKPIKPHKLKSMLRHLLI